MREIKFRAWDSFSKKMNEITHLRLPHREDLAPGLILMQFTGLLDKNGKEIYEGDILNEKIKDPDNDTEFPYPYVCFKDGMFTDDMGDEPLIDIITDLDGKIKYKVIGNIYENPELLK